MTLRIAKRVGAEGEVIGIDRAAATLDAARARANSLGFGRVRFVEGDLHDPIESAPGFDAVIGRRVLMYQDDPLDALHALSRSVRPGGIVSFHEVDNTIAPSGTTHFPLHEQVQEWIWRTLELDGTRLDIGFAMHRLFLEAGFTTPTVKAEAIIYSPTSRETIVPAVRALLPRLVANRLASEGEVGIETLEERLLEERRRIGETFVAGLVFSGSAVRPTA